MTIPWETYEQKMLRAAKEARLDRRRVGIIVSVVAVVAAMSTATSWCLLQDAKELRGENQLLLSEVRAESAALKEARATAGESLLGIQSAVEDAQAAADRSLVAARQAVASRDQVETTAHTIEGYYAEVVSLVYVVRER